MAFESELTKILLATATVLVMGIGIGYVVRRTGMERRLAAPICLLIIVPVWLVLGLFHLLMWQRVAILLLLYPGAILCAGTAVGSLIAGSGRHRRGEHGYNAEESES